MTESNKATIIPSTVRRIGRPLSPLKQRMLKEKLPLIEISLSDEERATNFQQIFGRDAKKYKEFWLEIGFGNGEHLAQQAENNKNIGLVGCELYPHGLAACVNQIEEKKLSNVRIFTDDARHLLRLLPENSLDRIFILFPDPWPKRKHYKRRLITQDFLNVISRVLKPDGLLRMATDHPGYASWILLHMQRHKEFLWCATKPEDWKNPPSDHYETRYQIKKRAGEEPVFLDYKRK